MKYVRDTFIHFRGFKVEFVAGKASQQNINSNHGLMYTQIVNLTNY